MKNQLCRVKDRERLEKVQQRFTRMVPGMRGLDYEERLERLNFDDSGGEKKSFGFD